MVRVNQINLFWLTYNVNKLLSCDVYAPANFILNLRFKMKKPCYFPVDFVYFRENRYSEFLFYLTVQKSWSSANIGRANVVCRVRWAIIWTRSVHYITLLCIWPHIIYYFTYNRCLNHFFFLLEKETLHLWPHLQGVCNIKLLVLP